MSSDTPKPIAQATIQRRSWVCIVNVSAPMPDTLADWPGNIQDGILAAMEKQCVPRRPYHDLVFVSSGCFPDPDRPGGWYIKIEVEELPTLLIAGGHRA